MKINIKYGLVALTVSPISNSVHVLHFCGYENEPKECDRNSLTEELKTNSEFGLIGRDDYIIVDAWEELITSFAEITNEIEKPTSD